MIMQGIFTAKTDSKGWGVFTEHAIEANTIIESSPVVVMSQAEKKKLDKTTLYNYIFDWNDNQCCMALGLVPVYNHSYESNCEYFQDYEEGIIFIKTVRRIEAGEELTINYNGDWNNEKPIWFEVID